MTNSELFTKAHKMTKKIIQAGDNYQATFGLALKQVRNDAILKAHLQIYLDDLQNNIVTAEKVLQEQSTGWIVGRTDCKVYSKKAGTKGLVFHPWLAERVSLNTAKKYARITQNGNGVFSVLDWKEETKRWLNTAKKTFANVSGELAIL